MKIGKKDDFESQYMAKFWALAAPHGIFMEYPVDRAGRDIGLHFTQETQSSGKIVVPSLVWFQMKGVMPSTLSLDEYNAAEDVSVTIEVAHLRFWYMNVQPTYLVVYVGSADQFLAIDINDWVRQHHGDKILSLQQKTTTVKIAKKNKLDDHLFGIIMRRNLVPALRNKLALKDDDEIRRFLRDSSIVKWLSLAKESQTECRLRVVKYLSKMRTEVYFETRAPGGEWTLMRSHWEFAMDMITEAYPFLSIEPKCKVIEHRTIERDEYDGEVYVHEDTELVFVDSEDDDYFEDADDIDTDCLMEIGDGVYSYASDGQAEMAIHELAIKLNEVGHRWAETLKALEAAEVISVDTEPHFIDVAPWHARDV